MSPSLVVRVALVVLVFAWILGPDDELRRTVPLLLVFALALGLEVQFLVNALRGGSRRVPDRSPREIDRDRYGFDREPDELVVVEEDFETWLALSEESEDTDSEGESAYKSGEPARP